MHVFESVTFELTKKGLKTVVAEFQEILRRLAKSPAFTVTAIITLAFGIGATTAIFTLVHQVMLKSLPVTNPDELWRIGDKVRCCNWGGYMQGEDGDFSLFSWEAYRYFREHTPEFVDLTALQAGNTALGVRRSGSKTQADTRNGEYVSGNFFRTFGVSPWIGRLLTDTDDQPGATPVAVMSYRIWQDKYVADRSVVGSVYEINGHPFTIIGVAAPGFYGAKLSGSGMPDFWLPVTTELMIDQEVAQLKRPSSNFLDIIGRVRPGVNSKSLEAKLKLEFHDWLASHVAEMEPGEKQLWKQQTVNLIPGGAGVAAMRAQYQEGLKLLLLAAACVLLVACSNVANLMLARGLKERQQTSIRVALGSSRGRLVGRALAESATLAMIGGVLGIAIAYAGTQLVVHLAFRIGGPNNYVPIEATPSWPVLLFALALSLLTGVLFGVAPAWMTSQVNPVEALRGANRSFGGGGSFAQKSLVVAQLAMSLVLVSAAALLSQSLRNLQNQNFGFESQGRYIAWINPTLSNYKPQQMEQLFRRIDDGLLHTVGARMVAPVLYAPMSGDSWNEGIRISGRPEPPAKEDTGAGWARVMPGFFETIGARMVAGRAITERDTATTRNIAVVNEAFVRRFFPKQSPLGQHFGVNKLKYASTYEIVGVVKDIRYMAYDFKDPVRPMFWLSETQGVKYEDAEYLAGDLWSHYLYNIVIWAPGNPPGIEARVRKALASVDPSLVLYSVDPYSEVLSADFQQQNMIAKLTLLFSVLGLVLAAIGLYGVMAYTVEQRRSEIGLRMALGADRPGVVGMVLRRAFVQVGIGLALGIPAAIGVGKLMANQLYGVKPADPAILSVATLLLCMAAILACLIPASRAASIHPMVALRND